MQQVKKVAKNTGILYFQMGITVFISLYSTRLILGALGVSDFGIFSIVGGAIAMLTFLNNAMTTATQRFMSFIKGEGNINKQKKIFNVSIILHIITGILVVVILEIAGVFLFDDVLKIDIERVEAAKAVYQFMLISTFFTIISVPYDAVINAHENMFLVAVLKIIESVLKLAIAFFIVQTIFDKLITYGLLMAFLSILLMGLKRVYCHRKYNEVVIDLRKYYDKPLFKEMTSFASWSFLGCTTSMVGSFGQGIVLNIFFGTAINSAQGVAIQVRGQLSSLASVVIKAINPMIAKSEGAGDRKLMLKASMIGSKVSFFLLLLLYVPIIVDMPFIFSLWLEDVPEYAVIFCRLLLVRGLIEQLSVMLRSAIGAVGDIRKFELFNAPLLILPLLVSWLLFEWGYPPYSLYIVFIVFELFNVILIIYFAKIYCNLSVLEYLKEVVLRCVFALLLLLVTCVFPTFYMQESLIRFVLILVISFVFFILSSWFIGANLEEKKYIRNAFYFYKQKVINYRNEKEY